MFALNGMKTVICGGTAGIGRAVGARFVTAGAEVSIVGRRDGTAVAKEIGAVAFSADVAIENEVQKVLEEVHARYGPIDVIINNAGAGNTGRMLVDEKMEDLNRTLDINFKGVYHGIKHGPRYMRDGGAIINTASIAGQISVPGHGPYSAGKAAIISLTKTAAIELGDRGIRVNAVCPGSILTEMLAKNPGPEIEMVKVLAPLGRIGEIEDIVGVYHFLAAPETAYITGAAIPVDGGILAGIGTKVIERLT